MAYNTRRLFSSNNTLNDTARNCMEVVIVATWTRFRKLQMCLKIGFYIIDRLTSILLCRRAHKTVKAVMTLACMLP